VKGEKRLRKKSPAGSRGKCVKMGTGVDPGGPNGNGKVPPRLREEKGRGPPNRVDDLPRNNKRKERRKCGLGKGMSRRGGGRKHACREGRQTGKNLKRKRYHRNGP